MSPITHIEIPIGFYTDKNLCGIKRAILGLALAFGDNGLKISDSNLAAMFGKGRQHINALISELRRDGYITIDKPGSKYRTLYCTRYPTGLAETSPVNPTGIANESGKPDRNHKRVR